MNERQAAYDRYMGEVNSTDKGAEVMLRRIEAAFELGQIEKRLERTEHPARRRIRLAAETEAETYRGRSLIVCVETDRRTR